MYTCHFTGCGQTFTVLVEWTRHVRSHGIKRGPSVKTEPPSPVVTSGTTALTSSNGIGIHSSTTSEQFTQSPVAPSSSSSSSLSDRTLAAAPAAARVVPHLQLPRSLPTPSPTPTLTPSPSSPPALPPKSGLTSFPETLPETGTGQAIPRALSIAKLSIKEKQDTAASMTTSATTPIFTTTPATTTIATTTTTTATTNAPVVTTTNGTIAISSTNTINTSPLSTSISSLSFNSNVGTMVPEPMDEEPFEAEVAKVEEKSQEPKISSTKRSLRAPAPMAPKTSPILAMETSPVLVTPAESVKVWKKQAFSDSKATVETIVAAPKAFKCDWYEQQDTYIQQSKKWLQSSSSRDPKSLCQESFDEEMDLVQHYFVHIQAQGPYMVCPVNNCGTVSRSRGTMSWHTSQFHPLTGTKRPREPQQGPKQAVEPMERPAAVSKSKRTRYLSQGGKTKVVQTDVQPKGKGQAKKQTKIKGASEKMPLPAVKRTAGDGRGVVPVAKQQAVLIFTDSEAGGEDSDVHIMSDDEDLSEGGGGEDAVSGDEQSNMNWSALPVS